MSALMRQIMALSPIHYWPCQEVSGSASSDWGSLGLKLTWTGVSLGQPGLYGMSTEKAPLFSSASGATPSTEIIPTNWTLGGFFYRTGTGLLSMMTYSVSGNPAPIGLDTYLDRWRGFMTGNSGGTNYLVAHSALTIVNSTWVSVIGTYDGTTMRLYLDGVESVNSTTTSGTRDTGSSFVQAGRYNGSGTPQYFAGSMSHLFVSASTATAGQVMSIYRAGRRVGVAY